MATPTRETASPAHAKNGSALISNARLQELYATMLRGRILDDRIQQLLRGANHLPAYESTAGEEASIVGTAYDLRAGDCVSSARANLVLKMMEGASLNAVLLSIGEQPSNNGSPSTDSSLTTDTSIGVLPVIPDLDAQLKIATGVALAQKLRKSDNLVVAFLPSGIVAADLPRDTMAFTVTHRLPIIFVTTQGQQTSRQYSANGHVANSNSYEFPVIPVDGSDVVAVYRVRQEGMSRARRGGGPTVIECVPGAINVSSKAVSSNGSGNRAASSASSDPIADMATYLKAKNLFSEEWRNSIADDFARELGEAISGNEYLTPRTVRSKRRPSSR